MMTKINSNTQWRDINWKTIEKDVFNVQKKIYYYSKSNDLMQVHKYQKFLITSFKSKLLAVRKVTQDNSGKLKFINEEPYERKLSRTVLNRE